MQLQTHGLQSLCQLLQNNLVLRHISPYLGIPNLVSLGATCKSLRDLVYGTPGVFQLADLTKLGICYRVPDSIGAGDLELGKVLSTDEIHAQALSVVFQQLSRHDVLRDVRTLILDGLTVPAGFLAEMLYLDSCSIRILSLRGVRDLGDEKLIQILRYIIRPSRPEGTPKLKGLYYFTPNEPSADFSTANLVQHVPQTGVTNSLGAQLGSGTSMSSGALHGQLVRSSWHQYDPWYSATGNVLDIGGSIEEEWARLIQASEGLIAYDVVLCRHGTLRSDADSGSETLPLGSVPRPTLAAVSLAGCQGCGSCPEGPAHPGTSAENEIPLLTPPPTHHPSVKVAQRLDTHGLPQPPFIARCRTCLKDRWCERCNIWWCESCYTIPRNLRSSAILSGSELETITASIKVLNNLCVARCLMDELLNGVGEGGMWG